MVLIEINCQEDICTLCVKGRLVSGMHSDDLGAKLNEIKNLKPRKLLMDVSELVSIGSTGVGFIMNIYTSIVRNPEGRFVLVGANSRVRQVLDITCLSKIIPLVPDITSGHAMLRSVSPMARTATLM